MQAATRCCWADKAPRISRAAFGSPKVSAAVLFDPVIVARVDRSWAVVCRKENESYTANTEQAISNAALLVSMTSRMSFWRMERFQNQRMLVFAPARIVPHHFRQRE